MNLLDHSYDLSYLQDGYGDFIRRWTEDEGEFTDGRFHASNLGQCVRKAVLKRVGLKGRPEDEDKQAMFAEANFIHAGMTSFWMKEGTAIAREVRFSDGPFPGWSGKFDALLHRPEWCDCHMDTLALQEVFSHMRLYYDLGRETEWREFRKSLIGHRLFLCSLKSVAPAGLKHYAKGPAKHHVWQDSWYAHEFAGMFELTVPTIIIMYRTRGGCATPIWHFVEPLSIGKLVPRYDKAYDRFLEIEELPAVLPLVAKRHKDASYGEVIKLEMCWECGYCDYSGWHNDATNFRCDHFTSSNSTGDRVAVNVGGRIHLVEEWYKKTNHLRGEVVDALDAMQEDESREDWPDYGEVAKSAEVKLT